MSDLSFSLGTSTREDRICSLSFINWRKKCLPFQPLAMSFLKIPFLSRLEEDFVLPFKERSAIVVFLPHWCNLIDHIYIYCLTFCYLILSECVCCEYIFTERAIAEEFLWGRDSHGHLHKRVRNALISFGDLPHISQTVKMLNLKAPCYRIIGKLTIPLACVTATSKGQLGSSLRFLSTTLWSTQKDQGAVVDLLLWEWNTETETFPSPLLIQPQSGKVLSYWKKMNDTEGQRNVLIIVCKENATA